MSNRPKITYKPSQPKTKLLSDDEVKTFILAWKNDPKGEYWVGFENTN